MYICHTEAELARVSLVQFCPTPQKKEYLNRSYTLFQDNIFFRRTAIQQNLSHPVQEVTGALPYPPINFLLPRYDLSIDTIFSWITIKIHCKTFHCHFNNKFLNIRVRCLDSRLKSKNTKLICFGCKLYTTFLFPTRQSKSVFMITPSP